MKSQIMPAQISSLGRDGEQARGGNFDDNSVDLYLDLLFDFHGSIVLKVLRESLGRKSVTVPQV